MACDRWSHRFLPPSWHARFPSVIPSVDIIISQSWMRGVISLVVILISQSWSQTTVYAWSSGTPSGSRFLIINCENIPSWIPSFDQMFCAKLKKPGTLGKLSLTLTPTSLCSGNLTLTPNPNNPNSNQETFGMSVKQHLEKSYLSMLPFMMVSFWLVLILTVCPNVAVIISLGTIPLLISFGKPQKLDTRGCTVLVLVPICWSFLWTEWYRVIPTIDTLSKLNVWWCTTNLDTWCQHIHLCRHHPFLLVIKFYVHMNIIVHRYQTNLCCLDPLHCVEITPLFSDGIVTFWCVKKCCLFLSLWIRSLILISLVHLIIIITPGDTITPRIRSPILYTWSNLA